MSQWVCLKCHRLVILTRGRINEKVTTRSKCCDSSLDDMKVTFCMRSSRGRHGISGVATLAVVAVILSGVIGNSELASAQTAAPSKRSRPSPTLPLTSFYETPSPLPAGAPGTLIRTEATSQYELPYQLTALRILYHSRTLAGADIAVSGVVLIPDGKVPNGGWPVIAWAHAFRGAAQQCAPSLARNLGVGPLLAMYANLGYAVVATDYAGLGASGGPSVLDMRANALDIIYSIPAARAAVKELGTRWIVIGAFQGGLAAVAVAESEVRDPNYLGSIVTSGLADAQPAYERFALTSSSHLMPVLASTVRALHLEFQVKDMLRDKALPAYERVTQNCGGQEEPEFTSEMLSPGWESNRFVKEFFERNTLGQKAAHGPVLVISGEADPVVPADMTAQTVARMCKVGDKVLFLKYPNVDASGAMGSSTSDQISWIKARFAGREAPSNCH
jgi:pimeloyl-ACP methyl ester carboxylesterase